MYYDKLNSWKADNYAFDWDNKSPALHVLLTQIYPSEMMKCALSHCLPPGVEDQCYLHSRR